MAHRQAQHLPHRTALSLLIAATLGACGGGSNGELPGLPGGGKTLEVPCALQSDPRLKEMTDVGIGLTSPLGLASGRYALPATSAPTQMVVMFHGNHNDSCSWRQHLQNAAALGAVTIAMDYTGQRQTPVEHYGWFVREGAADSIAAAQYFLARYPSIKEVFAFGVSMGGNTSGLAIASPDAVRADGSPLFDYWVVTEGAHNLTEEYSIIRSVAPAVPAAVIAQQEIEEENGGTLEEVPERYAEITNVTLAADMAALKGVVLVHAIDDGLVPTNQSREMFLALNAAGVPAHLFTIGGNGGAESGTTATAIPLGPLFAGLGQDYESPLAGHGWEGSQTHLVMKTSLEQLYGLMAGDTVSEGETLVPGN